MPNILPPRKWKSDENSDTRSTSKLRYFSIVINKNDPLCYIFVTNYCGFIIYSIKALFIQYFNKVGLVDSILAISLDNSLKQTFFTCHPIWKTFIHYLGYNKRRISIKCWIFCTFKWFKLKNSNVLVAMFLLHYIYIHIYVY